MADVPMPMDFSEEAVARWLYATAQEAHPRKTPGFHETPWDRLIEDGRVQTRGVARAVRALLREKVREAVEAATTRRKIDVPLTEYSFTIRDETDDEIVARVMGDHPTRRESASDEAPRA